MKTKMIALVLASLGWAVAGWAQAPAAAPAAANPASELQPALVEEPERPRPAAAPEVVPLISFDADYPLIDAINNLAENAGISFKLAPDLIGPNSEPVSRLKQGVGAVRLENVTPRQALDNLLAQHNLVMGTSPGWSTVFLGTPDSGLTPLEPEGGDLEKMAPEEDLQISMFGDPNKEVPLLTAVHMLARLAKINVMIDPRLKSGEGRHVGTSIIIVPPVATNQVILST